MKAARLIAAAFLFLGAYCPEGVQALAHAANSAHAHEHDDGTVHAHEHDAQDHHEAEPHCVDDAPRLFEASLRVSAAPLIASLIDPVDTKAVAISPRFVTLAGHDPPREPKCLLSRSAAGRAPPA